MNALFARALAASLSLAQPRKPRAVCDDPRILIIRRNRMGDMICTLPLVRALRRRYPAARLTVACDAAGVPIAQACSAIDRVIPLERGWYLWTMPLQHPHQWQDFDWVVAAKAGFDRRLASLARLSNAARRIGYGSRDAVAFYTDPVPMPPDLWNVHQVAVDATLRLLEPLGIAPPADSVADLELDLPDSALAFAEALAPSWQGRALVLVNISSTSRLRFAEVDFADLATELGQRAELSVAFVALPADLPRAERLAAQTVGRARVIPTPGPLELAALLARARVFLTGEGGAAHLAAATGTAAVVLWSDAPFEKWHSRGRNHVFLRAEPDEETIPLARVREALAPYL